MSSYGEDPMQQIPTTEHYDDVYHDADSAYGDLEEAGFTHHDGTILTMSHAIEGVEYRGWRVGVTATTELGYDEYAVMRPLDRRDEIVVMGSIYPVHDVADDPSVVPDCETVPDGPILRDAFVLSNQGQTITRYADIEGGNPDQTALDEPLAPRQLDLWGKMILQHGLEVNIDIVTDMLDVIDASLGVN